MTPIIDLQSACPFALLAATAITNVPVSVITGDVGLSPATGAGIGLTCAEVTGNIYSVDAAGPLPCVLTNPALLTQAQLDLQAAITAGYGLLPTQPVNTPLTGATIVPGVYPYSAALGIAAGVLTFNGAGDYVFQVPTLLTIGVGVTMVLAGGANAKRIFWVTDTTTINTGGVIKGNVLAQTSISVANLTNIEGKLLAHDGAITLDQNTVSSSSCFSCPPIALAAIPITGNVGQIYIGNATASGGTAPYTYAVTVGVLPAGLVLNVNTGEITGIPTLVGVYNFTITATDANLCEGVQAYTITISASSCPIITVYPPQLPNAVLNASYNQTVRGVGGNPPYTFSILSGVLPTGLVLDPVTGVISGTPTVLGDYTFEVTATDADDCSGLREYTIRVMTLRNGCPC